MCTLVIGIHAISLHQDLCPGVFVYSIVSACLGLASLLVLKFGNFYLFLHHKSFDFFFHFFCFLSLLPRARRSAWGNR